MLYISFLIYVILIARELLEKKTFDNNVNNNNKCNISFIYLLLTAKQTSFTKD